MTAAGRNTKVAKSLLLGSAVGFTAAGGGAHAADLPVKAKPVEYVKVCSQYGEGFFYIPSTDTCIKIGGRVRVQTAYNASAGGVPVGIGSASEAPQGAFTRALTNDVNFRTRIYFSVDARQQTDYGVLRTYLQMGVQQSTPVGGGGASSTGTAYWSRAFIQFAGFTVGRTVSFFDSINPTTFIYDYPRTTPDWGEQRGITVWAYTAQLGNGVTVSVSAEDPNGRRKLVDNADAAGWSFGVNTNANGLAANAGGNGFLFPDVVGNLRVDQAWGSAQIMGAMHDASGQYYTSGVVSSGHPDNAYGWAVGGGAVIDLPNFGATGIATAQPNNDQFQVQALYTQGAAGYSTDAVGPTLLSNGANNAAVGWLVDGIYKLGSGVELTTAWSAWAGYQHIWTPNWRTSLYGGHLNVSYDSTAIGFICGSGAGSTFLAIGTLAAGSPCNPNFSVWQAGSRTQWNPVSQLDVGLEVLYSRVDTAFDGATTTGTTALPGQQTGKITFSDQGVWSAFFRVQRNFVP
jgi:hypothetical protein